LDAQWTPDLGLISEIDAGFRYSDHDAVFNQTAGFSPLASTSNPTAVSSLYMLENTGNFLSKNSSVPEVRTFWVANPDVLRDLDKTRAILGVTAQRVFTSLNTYTMSERIMTGYAMAKFDTSKLSLPILIDGNVGVRFVNTSRGSAGTATCATSASSMCCRAPTCAST
jgi:hypothetical protein